MIRKEKNPVDMRKPLAYFESLIEHCKFELQVAAEEEIRTRIKKDLYEKMLWELEAALDKENRKATGEIEY